MASCNVCQLQGLVWSENPSPTTGKHYLFNENTGQVHNCKPKVQPNAIPVYDNMDGITFDRKPESLALAITNECLRVGLNPFTVKLERKGSFIILH